MFVKLWEKAYIACKASTWEETRYPCVIHVFVQMIGPITDWIYHADIGYGGLTAQAWKSEPRRFLNVMIDHWGFRRDSRLHNTSLSTIISVVQRKGTPSVSVKQQYQELKDRMCDMGDIHPEQEDDCAYQACTLKDAFQLALKNRLSAAKVLLQYAIQKALLLKRKYAHEIRTYILKWKPWNYSTPGERERMHMSGHPRYVYYIAGKWAREYQHVHLPHKVEVEDIRPFIDAEDGDRDSIGRNQVILRELSREIPTDGKWHDYAYSVQSSDMDIYNPALSSTYSGKFPSIPAFFEHVVKVGREMSKMGTSDDNPAQESSRPRPPSRVNLLSEAETPLCAAEPSGHRVHLLCTAEQSKDMDEELEEDLLCLTLSAADSVSLTHIFAATKVRDVPIELVVSREEWDQAQSRRTDNLLAYEKKPTSWAGIYTTLVFDFKHTTLRSRLKGFAQTSGDYLCDHLKVPRIEMLDRDLAGCPLPTKDHLNRGSHTAATCTQNWQKTLQCIRAKMEGYAQELTQQKLAELCKASNKEKCQADKCQETGYNRCPAQKTFYFTNLMVRMLQDSYKGLQDYAAKASQGSFSEETIRSELKPLIISTVIQAFTLFWMDERNN